MRATCNRQDGKLSAYNMRAQGCLALFAGCLAQACQTWLRRPYASTWQAQKTAPLFEEVAQATASRVTRRAWRWWLAWSALLAILSASHDEVAGAAASDSRRFAAGIPEAQHAHKGNVGKQRRAG